MLGLPDRTEFNKRIPKQKFYEHMELPAALKRVFVEQIRMVWWRNKLAATTVNIAAGDMVTEIEVFEVCLQQPRLEEAILRQMDREIPYHILFLLTCEGKEQAWIGYKEATAGGAAFKVSRYYHTAWVPEGSLRFSIGGLNMDAVYASLVRQIAGDALPSEQGETLQASVARSEAQQQLERRIVALEAKLRKEKQLNRRMEYNAELKKLRNDFGLLQ